MSEIKAIEDQISQLQTALDQTVAAAQRRKTSTLIVMLVAVVAMAIYLTVAYNKVADFDSEVVVYSLESYIHDQLNASTADLSETLQSYAPTAMDRGEEAIRAMPARLVEELKTQISAVIEDVIPELEAGLINQIQAAVEHAKEVVDAHGDGKVDEAAFKKMLDTLAAAYGGHVDRLVTEVYNHYTANSAELFTYLDGLSRGQGLDQRQRHHQRMIVIFLQLMEVWGNEKAS